MLNRGLMIVPGLFTAFLLFSAAPIVHGEEYEGLTILKTAKVVFDVREGNPKAASFHLKLAHRTYKEFSKSRKNPAFVVVFSGPSVKLISRAREEFSPEDRKSLDEIADTVSAMSKDGIETEICLIAAGNFDVDPATVLPEIKRVGNGWISLIVRQSRGYSLLPVY